VEHQNYICLDIQFNLTWCQRNHYTMMVAQFCHLQTWQWPQQLTCQDIDHAVNLAAGRCTFFYNYTVCQCSSTRLQTSWLHAAGNTRLIRTQTVMNIMSSDITGSCITSWTSIHTKIDRQTPLCILDLGTGRSQNVQVAHKWSHRPNRTYVAAYFVCELTAGVQIYRSTLSLL
jgi:hypothetical protein